MTLQRFSFTIGHLVVIHLDLSPPHSLSKVLFGEINDSFTIPVSLRLMRAVCRYFLWEMFSFRYSNLKIILINYFCGLDGLTAISGTSVAQRWQAAAALWQIRKSRPLANFS